MFLNTYIYWFSSDGTVTLPRYTRVNAFYHRPKKVECDPWPCPNDHGNVRSLLTLHSLHQVYYLSTFHHRPKKLSVIHGHVQKTMEMLEVFWLCAAFIQATSRAFIIQKELMIHCHVNVQKIMGIFSKLTLHKLSSRLKAVTPIAFCDPN